MFLCPSRTVSRAVQLERQLAKVGGAAALEQLLGEYQALLAGTHLQAEEAAAPAIGGSQLSTGTLAGAHAQGHSGAGDFYFDVSMDCSRAPGKSAFRPTNEPWRGAAHQHLDCGEDSFMLSPSVLAVADGVGGWRDQGVDPSLFANSLMKGVREGVVHHGIRDPKALMQGAYTQTRKEVELGSSTCLVAALEKDGLLSSANMGDSGLMVIRGNQCVHRTKDMLFGFNAPFQLSAGDRIDPRMVPERSDVNKFQTQPGDVVILSTDGLLDNLHEEHVVQIVNHTPPHSLAKALRHHAGRLAEHPSYMSPFAQKARESGRWYSGGKPDDITVVVGRVARK